MPAETFEITSYQYYDFASRDTSPKTVALCSGSGKQVNIWFVPDSEKLPESRKISDTLYMLYYRHADRANVIDMLRNEKPVYMIYVPDGSNNSRLSTGAEPVGEGELR